MPPARLGQQDLVNAARAATRDNLNAAHTEPPEYLREYRRFKQWVDGLKESNEIDQNLPYFCRELVDNYFAQVIVHTTRQNNQTVRRIVPALQFYANREEDRPYSAAPFQVRSPEVDIALEAHGRMYRELYRQNNGGRDPHANLPTDVLSIDEQCRCVRAILGRTDWATFLVAWNMCTHTLIRMDSFRKLTLKDLKMDFAHGAIESGPNSMLLSIILHKYVHKERSPTTRVTGNYRHKDPFRCATGTLGFSLLVRLNQANDSFHFFKSQVPRQRPPWMEVRLDGGLWQSSWNSSDACKSLLASLDLFWEKVSHLRKLGSEHGSFKGLSPHEIATLSKHIVSFEGVTQGTPKVMAYQTELYKAALLVFAGFEKKDDEYFVARTLLQLPPGFTIGQLVRILFPRIDIWRAQQSDPVRGDNKNGQYCASHDFLYNTLPHLALVIFQDGIYWLRDFPHHEATLLLLHLMPPWYPGFTRQMLAAAEQMTECRRQSRIRDFNASAQAAFDTFTSTKLRLSSGRGNSLKKCPSDSSTDSPIGWLPMSQLSIHLLVLKEQQDQQD